MARIPEGPVEELRFRPELIAWWELLGRHAADLRRCERWLAKAHPPASGGGLEQRSIPTLVLCLAGSARVEGAHAACDLAPGEALLLAPGAWHRHARPRPGAVVYRQGFLLGRSDFFLMGDGLHLVGTIPEQPSRNGMEEALLSADAEGCRLRIARLLAEVMRERTEPRPLRHPAVLAMVYAIENTLHLPGGTAAAVRASGLSRAQAYRWFRQVAGSGPAAWRRRQRAGLAAWLVREGLAPAEVRRRCGR